MFISHEIFNGSIPKVCMQQIISAADPTDWGEVYVGCSGLFSFERALKLIAKDATMHGNDVSLMSAAMAALARGETCEFRFKGKVSHWEEMLAGQTYATRVGALMLCLYLGRVYRTDNDFNRRHWRHYENRFLETAFAMRDQCVELASQLELDSYWGGDFRDHLRRGAEKGAALVISAPFIEGWYEQWFKFISENIEWDAPSYDIWSPDDFPPLLEELAETGSPYIAVYREDIGRSDLKIYHRRGVKPKFFVYSNAMKRSSIVDEGSLKPAVPFRYSPVTLEDYTPDAKVTVRPCLAGNANYVKEIFLQENIMWTQAPANYLVFIGEKLLGCLSIGAGKHSFETHSPKHTLYLLSDTCVTRNYRSSKLLTMLARCRVIADHAQAIAMAGYQCEAITTTVRSNMPVSMKYRGIYKKLWAEDLTDDMSGAKHKIIYGSPCRDETFDQVYAEWFKKHFKDDSKRKIRNSHATG